MCSTLIGDTAQLLSQQHLPVHSQLHMSSVHPRYHSSIRLFPGFRRICLLLNVRSCSIVKVDSILAHHPSTLKQNYSCMLSCYTPSGTVQFKHSTLGQSHWSSDCHSVCTKAIHDPHTQVPPPDTHTLRCYPLTPTHSVVPTPKPHLLSHLRHSGLSRASDVASEV